MKLPTLKDIRNVKDRAELIKIIKVLQVLDFTPTQKEAIEEAIKEAELKLDR
jgi:hypothetical protein